MFFQIEPRTGPAINPGSWMLDSLLPGLFIVMTHTSQHQVPPPSRTVPCELSALNLAAGLEDVEYLIHAEQPAFL